jgi:hypothetical protein|tara:strand:- start:168 stop:362 length:195 start_codon:yes stop_codon:yes gene_type:complete
MSKYNHTVQTLVQLEEKLEAVLAEVKEALADSPAEETNCSTGKAWKRSAWEISFSEDKEDFVAP